MNEEQKHEGLEEKKIVCWASPGCIHQCGLIATVKDGELVHLRGNPDYPTPNHGCADRMPHHAKWLYSSEQLLHPLKRKGSGARTSGSRSPGTRLWTRSPAKLAGLKEQYGAETLALHEGTYRNDQYGIRTRFLNLFGNPTNIGCAGTICRCNTVALNYALLGMANSRGKMPNLKCLVIDGCNLSGTAPSRLSAAQEAGGGTRASS